LLIKFLTNTDLLEILPDDVYEGDVEGIHIAWTNLAKARLLEENDDATAMKSLLRISNI
jgi:hypothetical protein